MRLLLAILLMATFLYADYDKNEHEENEKRGQHIPLDMRYLHLSKSQLKQAKSIIKKFRKDYKSYYQEKEKNETEIEKLFLSSKFNKEKFVHIMHDTNQYILKMQVEFFSKMHKILTPAQRKSFTRYMEEWEVE